jgi:hypothetical protein
MLVAALLAARSEPREQPIPLAEVGLDSLLEEDPGSAAYLLGLLLIYFLL